MLAFGLWWLVIQIFGLAALPLVRKIFARLPDQGYAFSKAAGLLLVSYLLWVGASGGLLVNNAGGILLALLIVAALSVWVSLRDSPRPLQGRLSDYWRDQRGNILCVETLFLLAFTGWAIVRAYSPDKILPAGGEKYMEIAFLNGVLNSPAFPPLDPWMSGYSIAYYYFGYVMMAVMVQSSGVAATVGFDLYDALLFALTAVSAYGVVSNMARVSRAGAGAAGGIGLLGALFAVGIGNLEGLLEGLYSMRALPEAFWDWLSIPDLAGSMQNGSFYPGHGWWWWRASRVLQDLDLFYQPIVYQPIDEFPFFSFLLGDNHPHKLALPFVLLCVGLAFNMLLRADDTEAALRKRTGGQRWVERAWAHRSQVGLFLFTALALGGLAFLNTWDFPILLGLVVVARGMGVWQRKRPEAECRAEGDQERPAPIAAQVILNSLAYALALGALSILLYLFFYLSFSSQAGGVLPYVFPPTRLPQYLVMFGPFILILAVFAFSASLRANRGRGAFRYPLRAWLWLAGILMGTFLLVLTAGALALPGSVYMSTVAGWLGGLTLPQALLRILQVKIANPWLFLVLSTIMALALSAVWAGLRSRSGDEPPRLNAAAQFALLLAFVGLGLTMAVEFFYLRDNFGMRMNTIFKFYFQAWVLMACASAYAIWWVANHLSAPARGAFLLAAGMLTAAGMVYPLMSIASRTEGFGNPPTLDAAATFAGQYPNHWAAQPDDYAAVQWLLENGRLPGEEPPIILEAGSGGYENAGRISAFTGFPSLLGWTNHEGQWRGTQVQIEMRAPVIRAIYTTPSVETALDLLHEWNVDYVILGNTERQYITGICQNPETPCQVARAMEKFGDYFELVFRQGATAIYRVPEAAQEQP